MFEAIFVPYNIDVDDDEIAFLYNEASKGDGLAKLCLILLEFSLSSIHYNFINGTKDELDEIQKETFIKLEELGETFPLAYKVAGDLHLAKMGKIVYHKDVAFAYFRKYVESSGDASLLENFEDYSREAYEKYGEVQNRQQILAIRKAFHKLK